MRVVVLALALAGASSCYDIRDDGTTVTIAFNGVVRFLSVAIPAIPILTIAAAATVLALRRGWPRWLALLCACWILTCLGCSGFVVPQLWMDRVTITDRAINQDMGFWFARRPRGFEFENIDRVEIRHERLPSYEVARVWRAHYRDGSSKAATPGTLWSENEPLIRAELEERGVRFE